MKIESGCAHVGGHCGSCCVTLTVIVIGTLSGIAIERPSGGNDADPNVNGNERGNESGRDCAGDGLSENESVSGSGRRCVVDDLSASGYGSVNVTASDGMNGGDPSVSAIENNCVDVLSESGSARDCGGTESESAIEH